MLVRMKIRILPTHANLSLFFTDSSWYINVVLLSVACGKYRKLTKTTENYRKLTEINLKFSNND